MPHAFDSGQTLSGRRLIRAQIVAKLAGLSSAAGLYAEAIVELPAPFDDGDDELLEMLNETFNGRSPAIAVALGERDFRSTGEGGSEWGGDLEVHVYVALRVGRGQLEQTKGDVVADADVTKDPGIETMLEHVFERLAGQRFNTAVGGAAAAPQAANLRPVSERVAYFGPDWLVWEQRYELYAQLDVNLLRGQTEKVLEVLADQDLNDGGAANPIAQTLSVINP